MKKGFQFLVAFAALFVGIGFVEAKDYQLDLIKNSIELNVDTLEEVKQQAIDGTIYLDLDIYYDALVSEEIYAGEILSSPKEDWQTNEGYLGCKLQEDGKTCELVYVSFPEESNLFVEKELETSYELVFDKNNSSMVIAQDAVYTPHRPISANNVTNKIIALGTLNNDTTISTIGEISGNLNSTENGVYSVKTVVPKFTVVANKDATLSVTITNPVKGVSYEVYKSTSKKGKYKKVATLTSAKPTYKESGAAVGTTFYYKVRAIRTFAGKKTTTSCSSILSAKTKLVAPTLTVASKDKTSISVKWTKVSGASGYAVYRSTSKNGKYKLVKTTTSTSFTDKKLATGKKYYYKVRAYKTVSKKKSYGSYSTVMSDAPKVAVPKVKVGSYDYNINKIAITKVSGASGYVIYRSTNPNSGYKQIATTTKTTYYDKKLTTGTTYYYKVKAYAKVGKSKKYGNLTSAIAGVPSLKTPTFTVANGVSRTSLKLTVTKVNGASGYDIYRKENEEFVFLTSITGTTYTDTDLTLGATYDYQVVAYRNVNGEKVYSKTSAPASAVVTPAKLKVDLGRITYNQIGLSTDFNEVTASDEAKISIYRKVGSKGTVTLVAEADYKESLISSDELEQKILNGEVPFNHIYVLQENHQLFYIDNDLTVGQTYYYQVVVTMNGVASPKSSEVSHKAYLDAPTDIVTVPLTYKKIGIAFDSIDGADGYEYYRSTSKNGKYTKIADGPKFVYNSSGTFNKKYYYKIRAYRYVNGKKVYSSYSKVFSFKTGIQALDKYPITLEGTYGTAKIKSTSFSVKKTSGNYVYYKFKVNFDKTYSTRKTKSRMTVYFYDEQVNLIETYSLTVTIPKGTKKNWSTTFEIKLPANAVYFYFK